jgi:hypothetical protein
MYEYSDQKQEKKLFFVEILKKLTTVDSSDIFYKIFLKIIHKYKPFFTL